MSEIEKLQQFLKNNKKREAQDFIITLEEKLDSEKSKYSQKILKQKIEDLKRLYLEFTFYKTITIKGNEFNFLNESKECNQNKDEKYIYFDCQINKELQIRSNNDLIIESKQIEDRAFTKEINDQKDKNLNKTNNFGENLGFAEEKDIKKVEGTIKNDQNKNEHKCIIENKNNCNLNIKKTSQLIFRDCSGSYITGEGDTAFIRDCKNCKFELTVNQLRLYGCENLVLKVYTKSGIYLEKCKNIKIESLGSDDDNKYRDVFDFSCPFEIRNYSFI